MAIKLKSKLFFITKKGHFADIWLFYRGEAEAAVGGVADDEIVNSLQMDDGLQSLANTGFACFFIYL